MPEYRGYVNPADVKATPTFDWGTVIKDVQKSLYDSEATRQGNRDKLEKDTNDSITAMGKVTLGKDEALNTKLTEAVYNSKKAVGDYAKLVREGKAAQKDFNLFNQNAMDTFNTIDAVGKNSKAAYDTYIEESKAGNLSAASDYMAQTLGLAASLKDKKIIMDNKGRGFIQGTDPNDLVEVNWLNNQRNLLIPKVQLDKELDAQADKIADFTRAGKVGAGGVWTINDPTVRANFDLFENNVANGLTSDPLRALSVLTDYGDIKGQRYTPTINEKEAKKDPSKIFVKLNASGNPEPVLTKDQDTAAKETAKRYLRERLTYEQKQVENTYRPPVFAPDKSDKPAPVVPTTADIRYTSSATDPETGKTISRSGFTMDVPLVDKSTGAAQNLKVIYLDPVTNELQMKIEEKNVIDGVTTVSDITYSSKKKGDTAPDISKISNIASQIYDPKRGRYLNGYQELYDYLIPQAKRNWEIIQKSQGKETPAQRAARIANKK